MKNIEKYPKTADAVIAYRAYRAADIHPLTFMAWADADESLVANPPIPEQEERKPESEKTDKPHPSSGLILGVAGLGLCMAARQIIDSDPHLLAKSMQQSPNAEVREYGYRVELAIEKSRNAESKKQEAT